MRRVLIVDDEQNLRHMLQTLLKREGYEPVGVGSVDGALKELEERPYDIIITDLRMPGQSGMNLVDQVTSRSLGTTVVVMTAYGSRDIAIEAMKRGAYDYISKPFEVDELVLLLRKAEERERLFRENQTLHRQISASGGEPEAGLGDLVARSRPMLDLFRNVRKIAEFKTTVLIGGESGTGKELVARAIHRLSPRSRSSFIAVNCGAIPHALLESELFGHRKGAFTDANRDRKGLFEEASGGTLFLDEIGELPLALQVKLLRVLQEGEIRRLGESQDIKVDVRVVAATARDLASEVARGTFREDLYYRLNVFSLHLPALRERREDIPLLVEHFIGRMKTRMGLAVGGASPEAMRRLIDYGWPGNVRELENCIERAIVLCEGSCIDIDTLPEHIRASAIANPEAPAPDGDLSIKRASRRSEEVLIRRALQKTRGNRTRAAELLEISHRALLYKIKEYGIGAGRDPREQAASETSLATPSPVTPPELTWPIQPGGRNER
ncbi:MAG: sigma-54 dependent transcriptional regulator [Polyangia bacterium]|jgi:two-component system response regulator AtoC